MISDIQDDYPSFIAEELVDSWFASCHARLDKVGKTLSRLYLPSMAGASLFGAFVGFSFGSDPLGIAGLFIATFCLIVAIPVLLSASTLMYYLTFRARELRGAWIGVFACECDGKWVKVLDKKELAQCEGMESNFIVKCPTCDWISRSNDIEREEKCGDCKLGMNHRVKCQSCNRPLYLEKLYKKRYRDIDGRSIEKGHPARSAAFRRPAGGAKAPGRRKEETSGGVGGHRQKAWLKLD
jgi:hypothetical protein